MKREDLERYLRQLRELGGPEVFLDRLTARELHSAMSAATRKVPPGPGARGARPQSRQTARAAPAAGKAQAVPGGPLAVLANQATSCARCRLHEGRSTVVFGEGSPEADLVVVGEAPGQDEDRTGRPFVGRAGKLLDLLLMAAGFPRASVYICNVLKCRPPNNRNPLPDEVEPCTSNWLHRQLELINPRVLLAVGKFAAQVLAGSDDAITRLRGRVHAYRGTPLIVSYHPAFLLRSPNMVRDAWQDFQLMRSVLDEQA
jgi:DNA polymerase